RASSPPEADWARLYPKSGLGRPYPIWCGRPGSLLDAPGTSRADQTIGGLRMSSHKLLAWFDQDEALVETHHNAIEALAEGDNRRSFLKKAGIGGALMMGSGALFAALAPAGADAAKGGDGRPPAKFGKGD